MNEPRYVDGDDPWQEEDTAWMYTDDLSDRAQQYACLAFDVTGRTSHTFRTKAEKRRWKQIDSQTQKGIIYAEWIFYCINVARSKNAGRARGIPMPFLNLTKYIQNKAAMQDWIARNPDKVRRPDNYANTA